MDSLTPEERSRVMGRVRSKDSRPEMQVRKLVFGLGYRYRLHDSGLPGCPDLVFRSRAKVIFVHGCFWHRHARCALARMPKSHIAFWGPKFEATVRRDRKNRRALTREGWQSMIIWECQLKRIDHVTATILRFLDA